MNIVEFLEARIAEDESAARGATEGRFTWASVDFNSSAVEAHGTRHDPARVLAKCKAKRAIIRHLMTYQEAILKWQGANQANDSSPGSEWRMMPFQDMAAVYADHPDYNPEWRHA